MVKQIVRDVFFLGQPSEPATKADIQVGKNLQDTLQANRERCVGMDANIRGSNEPSILLQTGGRNIMMYFIVVIAEAERLRIWTSCLNLG